jgi:hypothetical protein
VCVTGGTDWPFSVRNTQLRSSIIRVRVPLDVARHLQLLDCLRHRLLSHGLAERTLSAILREHLAQRNTVPEPLTGGSASPRRRPTTGSNHRNPVTVLDFT